MINAGKGGLGLKSINSSLSHYLYETRSRSSRAKRGGVGQVGRDKIVISKEVV